MGVVFFQRLCVVALCVAQGNLGEGGAAHEPYSRCWLFVSLALLIAPILSPTNLRSWHFHNKTIDCKG